MVHILFWNPDISSMTRERMAEELPDAVDYGWFFNWSFWEYENVHIGDICYLVRCSDATGPHGIVMRGLITSEPYVAEDWSGKGRKVFYADWYPQEFIDSEQVAPLSPEVLESLIPDFNWRGGHSGRPLAPEYDDILAKAWYDHLDSLLPKLDEGLYVNCNAPKLTPSTLDFWKRINSFNGIESTHYEPVE